MLRPRRRTIAARAAALVTALLVVACPHPGVTQGRPSVAELLTGYIAWLRYPEATRPLFEFDLDAARSELARLAPTFLFPLEGRITQLRGRCRDAGRCGDRGTPRGDVPAGGQHCFDERRHRIRRRGVR